MAQIKVRTLLCLFHPLMVTDPAVIPRIRQRRSRRQTVRRARPSTPLLRMLHNRNSSLCDGVDAMPSDAWLNRCVHAV